MLFIKIMLAVVAFITGGMSIIAIIVTARGKTNSNDTALVALMISCVLALGFLGLLLK